MKRVGTCHIWVFNCHLPTTIYQLGIESALQKVQGDYTMKKMIEKIVDAILELVAGSFEIGPCNLKDEDLFTGAARLGESVG